MAMNILPNISRSKSNQTIKFGQLIQDNIRNIFLDKSCTKCIGKTIPDHFLKIFRLIMSKFYIVCSYCMPN